MLTCGIFTIVLGTVIGQNIQLTQCHQEKCAYHCENSFQKVETKIHYTCLGTVDYSGLSEILDLHVGFYLEKKEQDPPICMLNIKSCKDEEKLPCSCKPSRSPDIVNIMLNSVLDYEGSDITLYATLHSKNVPGVHSNKVKLHPFCLFDLVSTTQHFKINDKTILMENMTVEIISSVIKLDYDLSNLSPNPNLIIKENGIVTTLPGEKVTQYAVQTFHYKNSIPISFYMQFCGQDVINHTVILMKAEESACTPVKWILLLLASHAVSLTSCVISCCCSKRRFKALLGKLIPRYFWKSRNKRTAQNAPRTYESKPLISRPSPHDNVQRTDDQMYLLDALF